MCALGLADGAPAGPSGPAGLSADAALSAGEEAPRRGDAAACDLLGLTGGGGVGLNGDVGVVLLCDGKGVPGGCRGPADIGKAAGVLSPNLASNSLHTAKLRLMPSEEAELGSVPNPALAAASEPLASS